jgi:hypothetical protein
MFQHLLGLRNRVRRLEEESRSGEATFIMPNGTRAGMHRWELFAAMQEAIFGPLTRRAHVLLNAVTAEDGSHLHELARSLAAGPVLSTPSPQRDVTPDRKEIIQ